MRKNRKPEAAKARSGSIGPPAETGNRKREAAKSTSGSRGPPAETGNWKPEAGSGKGEKWRKMWKKRGK